MTPENAICDQVISALRGITRALDLHYRQLIRDYGLSGPQIMVLKAIHTDGPRPISEIARDVHLSHATVTDIVSRLGRKALVSRRQNELDRREVFVALTEEGIRTLARSPSLLHEKFLVEFRALDLWEQNQILSSLQRLASMIGTPAHTAPLLSVAPLKKENDSKGDPAKRNTSTR